MSPLAVWRRSRTRSSSPSGAAADCSSLDSRPLIVCTSSQADVPDGTPTWRSPERDADVHVAAGRRLDAHVARARHGASVDRSVAHGHVATARLDVQRGAAAS